MNMVPLGEFMPSRIPSVNPAKHPDELFELWSIPAFDVGEPDVVVGSEIGSSKKCVEPGDVLLSRIVPHIRRSWIVTPKTENRQIASGEWITFRSDAFDAGYMRHILISDPFHAEFMQTVAGVGGSLLRARPDGVKQIEIPLPPLEEQRRIAGILDQADMLRRLRTRALDKLNTLGQAIFHEMFGDTVVPRSIQELIDDGLLIIHKDGNHGSNYPRKEEFGETGVPFLSAKAIDDVGALIVDEVEFLSEEKANKLKIGWIEAGDVLLSHNASVGKVSQYRGELGSALIGTSLTCFRPDTSKLRSGFLEFALRSTAFQTQLKANMSQTTRNQVPITAQKRITLAIPSNNAQQQFESQATNLIAEMKCHRSSLRHSADLFASLQHRAFRGEL